MSRYTRLKKLLEENPNFDISSFYSKPLLDLRSLLFEWVDAQDWFEVANLGGLEERVWRSRQLLDQALTLLQNTKTPGLEFHIRNIETQLKQAYKDKPEQFVLDLACGLREEDNLTSSMMAQPPTMAEGGNYVPVKDLEQQIITCEKHIKDLWSHSRTRRQDIKNQDQTESIAVQQVCNQISTILQGLIWHVNCWKMQQLHRCVRRQPVNSPENSASVEMLCEKVCALCELLLESVDLKTVDSLKTGTSSSAIPAPCSIRNALQDIFRKLVAQLFVVIEQPTDLTLMIEKGREQNGTYNSKRFNTTVGLLGGRGLLKHVIITDLDIRLAFSHDLAQGYNPESAQSFRILGEKDQQRRQFENGDSLDVWYQMKCEKVRVEAFKHNRNKGINKLLYHVVYSAKVIFKHAQQDFTVPAQVISLPIILRTGAIQGPEHIGCLLWHSFTSKNVYDLTAEMATSMSIDSIIEMINERILSIGGRGLQPYERQFLQNRLMPLATNGKGEGKDQQEVKLDSFVKDKVKLSAQGAASAADNTRPFSLWLWLYSVFNLLQESLKEPWLDGVIYGFASREHCINVLENSSVPNGTFLLRFSESYRPGNHMNCKGAIAMVLKEKGKAKFAPPISTEMLESLGLAHMIQQTGRHCKSVLGTGYSLKTLRQKYPPKCPESECTQFEIKRYPGLDDADDSSSAGVKRQADKETSPSAKQCCLSPGSPDSGTSFSTASSTSFSVDGDHFQSVGILYRSKSQLSSNMGSPPSLGMGSPCQAIGSPQSSSLAAELPQRGNIPSVVMDEVNKSSFLQDGEGGMIMIDSESLVESNPDLKPGQKMQLIHVSGVPKCNTSFSQVPISEVSLFTDPAISSVIVPLGVPPQSTESSPIFLVDMDSASLGSEKSQSALPMVNLEHLDLNKDMVEHS